MTTGIYKITNLVSGKHYIGQSIHIETRWKEHQRASTASKRAFPILYNDIQKYGVENFSFEILKRCEKEQLIFWEEYYIRLYKSMYPHGYNLCKIVNKISYQFRILSEQQVKELILLLKEDKKTNKELATLFGVSIRTITRINTGESYNIFLESYPLRPSTYKSQTDLTICPSCGRKKDRQAKVCLDCYRSTLRTVERPTKNELKKLLKTHSFIDIGKMFGVSDNSIRKWCKDMNLPYRMKDIKKYSEQEWELV